MGLSVTQLIGFGAGGSYIPEAAAYFKRMADEGQPLDGKRKDIINKRYKELIAADGYSKLRFVNISVIPQEVQSKINMLSPSDDLCTLIGTPRFRANQGWDANGANGRQLILPKLMGAYTGVTNTSSHIGVYATTVDTGNTVIAAAYIGAGGSGTNYTYSIAPFVSGNTSYWRICDQNAYAAEVPPGTTNTGHWIASRLSTVGAGYINGTRIATSGAAPTPVVGHVFGYPGIPNIGSSSNTGTINLSHMGLGLTDDEAAALSPIFTNLVNDLKAA